MTHRQKFTFKGLASFAFIFFSFSVNGQTLESNLNNTNKPAVCWELAFGETHFANTTFLKNRAGVKEQPVSFHYYVSAKMALDRKKENSNFHLKAGIGPNLKTFGLNQTIEVVNDKLLFRKFPNGNIITYSIFQQWFVDVPVMFTYESQYNKKRRNFSLEGGGIFGIQVHNRWKTSETIDNIKTTRYEEDLPQTQLLHYGSSIKIATTKKREFVSTSFFVSGSYFFSDVFKPTNNTPTNSYTVRLGIAITADNLIK